MDLSESGRNPVDELAEEFVESYRRGDRPSVQDYADRFPQWADKIRTLFPALMIMEKVRPEPRADEPQSVDGHGNSGKTLERLGDYRILREVGRGGMGVVYEAEQESLGRHVALKVFFNPALLDARHLQRFQREAKAAARLHHSNIVPVHGVGEQDGMHYYVMQFIQGLGLDQVLEELRRLRGLKQRDNETGRPGEIHAVRGPAARGPAATESSAAAVAHSLLTGQFHRDEAWPKEMTQPAASLSPSLPVSLSSSSVQLPGQARGSTLSESGWQYWRSVARIGIQVAEALSYANSQGVLHRDIKPSNLLLDTHGAVWVTDFGLAKADTDPEDLTHTGDIVGTLRYMAPERFTGQSDARSDVYALGLTLYEMLTLRPAFPGTDRPKLMQEVLHEEPVRPRKLNPLAPRDLETVVLKSIARDPALRYQGPAELAEDLQRFLDDRPIRARRQGALARGWRWCRRNPVVAGLSAAVALLVLAVAIGSPLALWSLRHEHGQTLTQLQRAEIAEQVANDRLWDSLVAEAQARRWSGQPGRHFKSLEALTKAAAVKFSLELRNEAIACMSLVDVRLLRRWDHSYYVLDADCERYARWNELGTVWVHRVADDVQLAQLSCAGHAAHNARFSDDGRWLFTVYHAGGAPSHLQLWDLHTGQVLLRADVPAGAKAIGPRVFHPDNRRFAYDFADGTVRIVDLPSGNEVSRIAVGGGEISYAFHPTEPKLAAFQKGSSEVQIRDADSGALLSTLKNPAPMYMITWRPDGSYLAAAGSDNVVRIWDMRTEKLHRVLQGHQSNVIHCAFSPDGGLLASAAWDGTTRLWDPDSGQQHVAVSGYCSHFSRDGQRLAYSFADLKDECGVWEVARGEECRTLRVGATGAHGPWTVTVHAQGRLAASGHDDGVRLWDLAVGQEIGHLPLGRAIGPVFDAETGDLFTSGAPGIQRWPVRIEAATATVRLGVAQTLHTRVATHQNGLSLSRDGRWLASPLNAREALVVAVEPPHETRVLGPHPGIWIAHLSPDGRWVATGTQHGAGVKVWDARNGKLAKDLDVANYAYAAFSPDSRRLVAGSVSRPAQLWKVDDWDRLAHGEGFGAGVFSNDGRLYAKQIDMGRALALLDAYSGDEIARLQAPDAMPIAGVTFTPDGSALAACCYNLIQLWDLRTIRRQLKEMNLDWSLLDYPPPPVPPTRPFVLVFDNER